MSILSTNHRLISIGESYSAGNGIDITDQVISVTGDATPYSAGENIDIQDHIISGKDWSQDITEASSHAYNETTAWVQENYANSADMTYISAVVDTKLDASAWSTVSADYATESYVIMADNITYDRAKGYVDSQQFAKESACQSAFDYLNTNKLDASSFTDWQNGQYSTDLQTIENQIENKYDTSSFAEVSGDFQPKGDYAERDFVLSSIESSTSGKLDVSSFASVSGDFLTNEDLNGYATETLVEETSGAITSLIPTDYYPDTNPSSFATEDWVTEQGYITGVSIPESAHWEEATNVYEQNSASYLTVVDLTPYQTIEGMTAYQPVGDYTTTAEVDTLSSMLSGAIDYVSANAGDDFPQSADEAIQTYQQNSGTYLTEHQDISYLMPKSESANFYPMTGNPSGFINDVEFEEINLSSFATSSQINELSSSIDYVSANVGGDMFTAYLEYNDQNQISGYNGSAFAGQGGGNPEVENYVVTNSASIDETVGYVQTNSAVLTGMIDGKQDTLTFGYDEQDRINSINSSALAGGGDVPEDVMVETNLEFNAVNEISGYNGSAIAQYGAEKQWLVHDDTLVHAANSAQYALGVNLSAVAQLLGVDETVLFSGMRTTGTITLSEPADNFKRVKILYCINDGISNSCEVIPESTGVKVGMATFGYYQSYCREKGIVYTLSGNTLTPDASAAYFRGGTNTSVTASTETPANAFRVNVVYGIGRKS